MLLVVLENELTVLAAVGALVLMLNVVFAFVATVAVVLVVVLAFEVVP